MVWPAIKLCGFGCHVAGASNEAALSDHGLAMIASSIEAVGHRVQLIDLRGLKGWPDFEAAILGTDYDVACIGFHSVDEEPARKAVETMKRLKPDKPVIAGGIHLSITHARFPPADCVVYGEGDFLIRELLFNIEHHEPIPEAVSATPIEDLDVLPVMDRTIFNQSVENGSPFPPGMPQPFFTMVLSRGCWYKKCVFCYETNTTTPRYRLRSPEKCIAEIKSLKAGSIMFHDDIFPHKAWCEKFVQLWKEAGIPRTPFWTQMRADQICKSPETIELLAEIGLTWVSLGVESGSQRMLDFLGKGTTVEMNKKSIQILHENNVNCWCNLVFGLPTETVEDIQATIKLLEETRPAFYSLSTYTCYPGSKLYKYCEENKLFLDEHYSMARYPYERKISGVDYNYLRKTFGHIGGHLKGPMREWKPKEKTG